MRTVLDRTGTLPLLSVQRLLLSHFMERALEEAPPGPSESPSEAESVCKSWAQAVKVLYCRTKQGSAVKWEEGGTSILLQKKGHSNGARKHTVLY